MGTILYQRRQTPFILRFLPHLLSPAKLFMALLLFVTLYILNLGVQLDPSFYLLIGIVGIALVATLVSNFIESVWKLVLIEAGPSGLKVQRLRYDRIVETTFAKSNFELTLNRSKGRQRQVNGVLLRGSGDEKALKLLLLAEDIAKILAGVQLFNLTTLAADQQEFLEYQKELSRSVYAKVVNLAGYAMVIGLAVYVVVTLYGQKDAFLQWAKEAGHAADSLKSLTPEQIRSAVQPDTVDAARDTLSTNPH